MILNTPIFELWKTYLISVNNTVTTYNLLVRVVQVLLCHSGPWEKMSPKYCGDGSGERGQEQQHTHIITETTMHTQERINKYTHRMSYTLTP